MTAKNRCAPKHGEREFHELDPNATVNRLNTRVKYKGITEEDRNCILAFANDEVRK